MKKLNTLFLFLIITNFVFAQQDMNKVVFDEDADQEILIGYCNTDSLKTNPVTYWFLPEYESYSVDKETLNSVDSSLIPNLEIFVVMGTWCSDSQRELPRFLKTTEFLNIQSYQVILIGVDKNKNAGKIPIARMRIELVPTFIFYNDGDEIGRIIESPMETLEKDILNIISSI
ncbi:MAG: thioredoxin family protein [Bacteroidales bacterium]|jgi:thiol-disulfide isomerase/thioredoxin|nr:thioredoxin family protein [Bacteroidales bacterium]